MSSSWVSVHYIPLHKTTRRRRCEGRVVQRKLSWKHHSTRAQFTIIRRKPVTSSVVIILCAVRVLHCYFIIHFSVTFVMISGIQWFVPCTRSTVYYRSLYIYHLPTYLPTYYIYYDVIARFRRPGKLCCSVYEIYYCRAHDTCNYHRVHAGPGKLKVHTIV